MLDIVRSRVNGIDTAALGRTVAAIDNDPSLAVVGFDVTTRWTGQTRSETIVDSYRLAGERVPRRHKIVADQPWELFGMDSAANPQELLMAAFNACIVYGYVAGAAVRGIRLDTVEIKTSGELDLRGFLGLSDHVAAGCEKIEYEVRIKGDGSPGDFEEIHQNVIRTSPNYFNVSRPVRVSGTLNIG